MLGVGWIRMTTYYPALNQLVEVFQRHLKAPLRPHKGFESSSAGLELA